MMERTPDDSLREFGVDACENMFLRGLTVKDEKGNDVKLSPYILAQIKHATKVNIAIDTVKKYSDNFAASKNWVSERALEKAYDTIQERTAGAVKDIEREVLAETCGEKILKNCYPDMMAPRLSVVVTCTEDFNAIDTWFSSQNYRYYWEDSNICMTMLGLEDFKGYLQSLNFEFTEINELD